MSAVRKELELQVLAMIPFARLVAKMLLNLSELQAAVPMLTVLTLTIPMLKTINREPKNPQSVEQFPIWELPESFLLFSLQQQV